MTSPLRIPVPSHRAGLAIAAVTSAVAGAVVASGSLAGFSGSAVNAAAFITLIGVLGLVLLFRIGRGIQVQNDLIRRELLLEAAIHERYKDLVENASDPVFTVNLSGRFLTTNLAATRSLGYPAEELRGMTLFDMVERRHLPEVSDLFGRLAGGQRSVLQQVTIRSGYGQDVTLELNCRVRQGQGVALCADVIARDITQHKNAEAALDEARQAAESASLAKTEFLANMSHELRTPMNGILAMADLILDGQIEGEQKQNVQIVRGSAEALLRVLNDILDISTIEAGRMQLASTEFNLEQVLGDCIELVSLRASQKNLELVCDLDPALPATLLGDPVRLRQVLLNVLGNAVKFTGSGSVVLSAELISLQAQECRLRLAVRDTGIGISEALISRIFEPFSQGDGSLTRKYGGTGLGLAISSKLVDLMGGKFRVASRPGEGSVFECDVTLGRTPARMPDLQPLAGLRLAIADELVRSREAIMRSAVAAGGCCTAISNVDELEHFAKAPGTFSCLLVTVPLAQKLGPDLLRRSQVATILLGNQLQLNDQFACGLPASILRAKTPLLPSTLVNVVLAARDNITLPVPGTENATTGSTSAPTKPGACGVVLVAEDNKTNRTIATMVLTKAGFEVHSVENGREAVEAIRERSYDVILMDVQMPEMDGVEATRRIREWERSTGSRRHAVVALTANALRGDRERFLESGMDDYLSKPIKPAEMLKVVANWVRPAAHDQSACTG